MFQNKSKDWFDKSKKYKKNNKNSKNYIINGSFHQKPQTDPLKAIHNIL